MSANDDHCGCGAPGCGHSAPSGPCRPDIDYPCTWSYTVIGTGEPSLRRAVREVVGDREYDLAPSRESSGGKYVSMRLTLTVESEARRDEIHLRLGRHEAVKVAF